jgi:hypothetical protein
MFGTKASVGFNNEYTQMVYKPETLVTMHSKT